MGDDPVERAFELAHIRRDLVGQELHHLARHVDAHLLGLGLEDPQAQLVGGGVDVADQTAAEARSQALLHAFQVRWRLVGGDDDLPSLIDQGVERVEELFLCRVLAADELHVVDHQHVDGAELVLEVHRVLLAQSADKTVHELFRRKVDHRARRIGRADVPGDGVHEMGLAQSHAAVQEQRVEQHRRGLGDAVGGGVGEFVGLADDEILEREAAIQRRAEVVVITSAIVSRCGPGRGGGVLLVGRRRGLLVAFRLDENVDRADRRVLAVPQGEQPVRVVGHHPVAHETGGDGDSHLTVTHSAHGHGLHPALVRGLADLHAQATANRCPLLIDKVVGRPRSHFLNRPHLGRPAPRRADVFPTLGWAMSYRDACEIKRGTAKAKPSKSARATKRGGVLIPPESVFWSLNADPETCLTGPG